jgi:hypothetical protein
MVAWREKKVKLGDLFRDAQKSPRGLVFDFGKFTIMGLMRHAEGFARGRDILNLEKQIAEEPFPGTTDSWPQNWFSVCRIAHDITRNCFQRMRGVLAEKFFNPFTNAFHSIRGNLYL